MNAKFTRIAALTCSVLAASACVSLAPTARGDDRPHDGGIYIVPPQHDRYDDRMRHDMREPLNRFRHDVDSMYDVVSSYGGDNYGGLRKDVDNLRGAASRLSDELDRQDSHDIDRANDDVHHAMDQINDRVTHIAITRDIDDSWHRVSDSYRDLQDRLR